MEKIIGPAGCGKTKKLLQKVNKTNIPLICSNPQSMIIKAYAYGFKDISCVSYEDFIHNIKSYKKFYIDDLDEFLSLLGCNGYTCNNEN